MISTAVQAALSAQTSAAVIDAISRIQPEDLTRYYHTALADGDEIEPLTEGLAASPGAASGRIVLSAADAVDQAAAGHPVILVRPETAPDDVMGMEVSRGILTTRGGLASHAAVVARGWGIPAVVGASAVQIDRERNRVTIGSTVLGPGDELTVDGSTGAVYLGPLTTIDTEAPPELETLLAWADTVAAGRVQVRVNADTAGDAARGRSLGAQGIGLCRTEHMFLAPERLAVFRRFILAADDETRAAALAELEEVQTHDFEQLLTAMDRLPVTVRLLDPPLHEFLPDLTELTVREARGELTPSERTELTAARQLRESNPMIGTRGVRLALMRSGLYQMQVRALCRAVAQRLDHGGEPHIEIMIPLVVDGRELQIARGWVAEVVHQFFGSTAGEHGGAVGLSADTITVGVMIETPRAALTAERLAEHADFFSFGTNDLTQLTYAFSRDDVVARLLPVYQSLGILEASPFAELDLDGVGRLVSMACQASRAAKPSIRLGACGEHAGHPASIDFLVSQGLDSISCSPLRVPMARLAVAQSLLSSGRVSAADLSFSIFAPPEAQHEGSLVDEALDVDEALVLHLLRVKGFVTPAGFEASLGTMPSEIVAALVEAGHVGHVESRDLYSLTPEGREYQQSMLEGHGDGAMRTALAEPYRRFLAHNVAFKELCTNWQLRNGQPNDHTDAAYDQECIDGLTALWAEARPDIDSMAGALPRLGRYRSRLDEAAGAVVGGDTKRFTGVMCESFHDVWMELHEDLIVLQGIDRVEEGSF